MGAPVDQPFKRLQKVRTVPCTFRRRPNRRIEARKAFRTILKLDVKLSASDQVGAPQKR